MNIPHIIEGTQLHLNPNYPGAHHTPLQLFLSSYGYTYDITFAMPCEIQFEFT